MTGLEDAKTEQNICSASELQGFQALDFRALLGLPRSYVSRCKMRIMLDAFCLWVLWILDQSLYFSSLQLIYWPCQPIICVNQLWFLKNPLLSIYLLSIYHLYTYVFVYLMINSTVFSFIICKVQINTYVCMCLYMHLFDFVSLENLIQCMNLCNYGIILVPFL